MSLMLEIDSQYKESLKGKEKLKVSVIRMIKSAVKNEEIKKKKELDDSEVLRILATLQKQRNESIKQFKEGGREDLVQKEKEELDVLESFLPQALSPEEIKAEIKSVIEEVGASSVKDIGKVMKAVMPSLTGRADGKEVNLLVKEILQEG